MVFDHVGIMNEDEAGAVKFYRGLLGLEKIKESSVSPELARQLFGFDRQIRMLVFADEGLKVEIFMSPALPCLCLRCLIFVSKCRSFPGF